MIKDKRVDYIGVILAFSNAKSPGFDVPAIGEILKLDDFSSDQYDVSFEDLVRMRAMPRKLLRAVCRYIYLQRQANGLLDDLLLGSMSGCTHYRNAQRSKNPQRMQGIFSEVLRGALIVEKKKEE